MIAESWFRQGLGGESLKACCNWLFPYIESAEKIAMRESGEDDGETYSRYYHSHLQTRKSI